MRVIPPEEKMKTLQEPIQEYKREEECKEDECKDSDCNGTLSKEIANMLIQQIGHELSNYALYKSFAVHYNLGGLFKLTKYYEARAKEELLHSDWIYSYLNSCGVDFQYPEIPATKCEIKDCLTPFKATVDVEWKTTESISAIAKKALDESDFVTFSFLNGQTDFGKLIPEQNEELQISNDALHIAETGKDDWLSIQDSIHERYFNT